FNNLLVQNKLDQAVASGEASLLPLEADGSPSGSYSALKDSELKNALEGESAKTEGVAQGS
ncbi:MAG: hypothetical protein C0507_17270, partial [Cyanobacteria bacterium PR.3.49]|nr:hypothetical protein [Cyanobacteria bacterium PR.3.49]